MWCVIGRERSDHLRNLLSGTDFPLQTSKPPIAFPQLSHRFLLIINWASSNDKNKWILTSTKSRKLSLKIALKTSLISLLKLMIMDLRRSPRWCFDGNQQFFSRCLQLTDRLKHLFTDCESSLIEIKSRCTKEFNISNEIKFHLRPDGFAAGIGKTGEDFRATKWAEVPRELQSYFYHFIRQILVFW